MKGELFMIVLAIIGAILFIISGIICGISLFGFLYHKISEKTSKILSDVAFGILCIGGIFTWIFLIFELCK